MTIEELRDYVEEQRSQDNIPYHVYSALIDGIDTLEQEPSDDSVSRQAVNELSENLVHTTRDKADFLCNFWEGLRKLPPVTPKQRTGHWIFVDKAHEHAHCSECDYGNVDLFDGRPHNYCPSCGTKMVEPQENDGAKMSENPTGSESEGV